MISLEHPPIHENWYNFGRRAALVALVGGALAGWVSLGLVALHLGGVL